MNEAEIEGLANDIADARQKDNSILFDTIKLVIANYFEKNKIKPISVGLTDAQIRDFYRTFPHNATEQVFVDVYREWQKSQTFTLPEVKEVAVGLTDAQIRDLGAWLASEYHPHIVYSEEIKKWQKTESFAQPQLTPNRDDAPPNAAALAQVKQEIAAIDWSKAPKNANIAAVCTSWWDDKGKEITEERWQHFKQQRPQPPAPVVEAGQVWKGDGFDSVIVKEKLWLINGETKLKREVIILEVVPDYYQYDTDNFLANFERVGYE